MIDGQTITILQKHIRRTGRSFLQYVRESFPWTRGNSDRQLLDRVAQMLEEEKEVVSAIGGFLVKQHSGPPYLGAYPMHFTSYNFLEVVRLLPLLIEHQAGDVSELELDLRQVQDDQARQLLQQLLDIKKRHLSGLKEMKEKQDASSAEGVK